VSHCGNIPARILAAELDLQAAWERVRERSGMPGVDGVSARRFERTVAASLRGIETGLASGTYRCLPLRLAQIGKSNGSARVLLVPSVRDRVAQTAATQWLAAKWNPLFHPCSYAYRPGRGVNDALLALAEFRDRGYRWVLDADVRSFFDSIQHAVLYRVIAIMLGEASAALLPWIEQWVAGAVWTGSDLNRITRGVPQGSPFTPRTQKVTSSSNA
jgi:retron-type reverse transcriptase